MGLEQRSEAKQYLVSLGGDFYVSPQPENVRLSIPEQGRRFEITDTPFGDGRQYDQNKFVCRHTATVLVERYPDMWRIE